MNNTDRMKANLAVDFKRIAIWAYQGQKEMVKKYISHISPKYDLNFMVSNLNVGEQLDVIASFDEGNYRVADRALTMSNLILSSIR